MLAMFNMFKSKKPKTVDEIAEAIDAGGYSGTGVSEKIALQVTTVLACVDAIASACSVPELKVFSVDEAGFKTEARQDPIYRLLSRRPNDFQTSMEFRHAMTMHAAMTKGGLALKNVNARGDLMELIPVAPSDWTLESNRRYEFVFRVTDRHGWIGDFTPDEVFYLPNRQWDLMEGMDALRLARNAIGLSIEAEESQRALHQNSARPSGILSTKEKMTKETVERVKEAFKRTTTGKAKFGVAVLDNGLQFSSMSMTGRDAQHIETRNHQIEEMCRVWGVFPQIIGHATGTQNFASAEAFFKAHEAMTKNRWQTLWVQRLDEFVLDGEGPLEAGFVNQSITLASTRDQSEYVKTALGHGNGRPFMTQDEIRAIYGLNPMGGDAGILHEPVGANPDPETVPEEENNDDT